MPSPRRSRLAGEGPRQRPASIRGQARSYRLSHAGSSGARLPAKARGNIPLPFAGKPAPTNCRMRDRQEPACRRRPAATSRLHSRASPLLQIVACGIVRLSALPAMHRLNTHPNPGPEALSSRIGQVFQILGGQTGLPIRAGRIASQARTNSRVAWATESPR